jgi:hypothetical protein
MLREKIDLIAIPAAGMTFPLPPFALPALKHRKRRMLIEVKGTPSSPAFFLVAEFPH